MKHKNCKSELKEKDVTSRVYAKVENSRRLKLIQLVEKRRMKLVKAAKLLNIKYQTAKSIIRTFKKENRILRKDFLKILPNKLELTPFSQFYEEKKDFISGNLLQFTGYYNSNVCEKDKIHDFYWLLYSKLTHLSLNFYQVLTQINENQERLNLLYHLVKSLANSMNL